MENHQIKLIDNTYSKSEAKDLLSALINDKIRFLKQKVFSIQERLGGDTSHHEKRIAELQQEKAELVKRFRKLENMDFDIEIDCYAFLKIKEKQRAVV
jgi:hypothetical protein